MKPFQQWVWSKLYIPPEERQKTRNLMKVTGVECVSPNFNPRNWVIHPVCLITGDGDTLPQDLKEFESWGFPHDVYCVNRSLAYMTRPVNHWTAIDCEESMWFSENMRQEHIPPSGKIVRHTIGVLKGGYDCFWQAKCEFENEYSRRLFVGNSGYFAVLSALAMGYQRIVLAGMPLNKNRHWYDDPDTEGPQWVSECYTTWMDFAMEHPDAKKVRSMSGYTAFILGRHEQT